MSLPSFEKLSSEHFLLLQDPSRKKKKEEKQKIYDFIGSANSKIKKKNK